MIQVRTRSIWCSSIWKKERSNGKDFNPIFRENFAATLTKKIYHVVDRVQNHVNHTIGSQAKRTCCPINIRQT